ncbi:PP2C family protein-serine/threonine phosphatase [Mucilaginibacter lappiensis]|uniref:PP2C family protein-serine/threonine phosphatase n=1 Tax=Mucilaginibacter lappiensis TaxID=354630 RepID=UPI003D1C0FA5
MGEQHLKQYKIEYQQFSEIGKRKSNQDKISALQINDETSLFLVADGMGGYSYGDLAAELVIQTLNEQFSYQLNNAKDDELLSSAVSTANERIKKLVLEKGAESGATLGGILIHGSNTIVFWVGDVKLMILRNNKIHFSSVSHTLENELRINNKSKEVYINSSVRHVVTRSICGKDKIYYPEIKQMELAYGDKVLVASDGFYELYTETEILRIIQSDKNWLLNIVSGVTLKSAVGNDNSSGFLIELGSPFN